MVQPDWSLLIEQLAGAKVLVAGDVMLDIFTYGDVGRISPEAPVPVLKVSRRQSMLGGAGNVIRNLAVLGNEPGLVAIVGEDVAGETVSEELARLTPAFSLIRDGRRPTTKKTRFIAHQQQVLRVDEEEAFACDKSVWKQVLDAFKKQIKNFSAVIISDYGKGFYTRETTQEIITLSRKAKVPVLIDPKSADFSVYKGATLITPNRKELEAAAGKPLKTYEAIDEAAKKLIHDHNLGGILVTLSSEGMRLVRPQGTSVHVATKAREVYDVSGAGDTVIALMAAGLSLGWSEENAMQIANAAAGVVVGKLGTAVASRNEILSSLLDINQRMGHQKIMTWEDAAAKIKEWRIQGFKVGFTNGCFDIVHPGHVSIIAEARANCDRLIVAINTDDSVRRLNKGPERPLQKQDARAQVLASMENVDMVVMFGEDTPYEIIKLLMPDVLVKGADYTIDKVVGADIVQQNGGKVVLAQLVKGQSTTNIARKMAS